jgi:HD-like signal output (HDOD) protein
MVSADSQSVADQMAARVRSLATLPLVALQINRLVGSPRASARALQTVVEEDPALVANIVRVANSPMFGYAGGVGSLDRAIFVLGFQAVRNIAMATSLTPVFRTGQPALTRTADELWRHALATGVAATLVATVTNREEASDAFLAGLLHDIGLTAALQCDGAQFLSVVARAETGSPTFLDLELEAFGATHEQIGAALLTRWRFPRHLTLAAAAHHAPDELDASDRRVPRLVYLADWIAAEAGLGFALDRRAGEPLDSAVLDSCGLDAGIVFGLVRKIGSAFEDVESVMAAA